MDRTAGSLALLCGLGVALTSCSAGPAQCTEIAALAGLSITVDGGPAVTAGSLELTACTDDGCTTTDAELHQGSTTTSETCTPDGLCSARSTPDGTLTGFAVLDLPDREVDVEVTVRHADGTTSAYAATVVPAVVHPNGEGCGGEAVQGRLILDDAGLRPQ